MTELHVYSYSRKLLSLLERIDPIDGLRVKFHAGEKPSGNAVIISAHIPASTPECRYILCTKTPQVLSHEVLNRLYDLWPMPLTPALTSFLFRQVMLRVKAEHESSSGQEYQKRLLEMAQQDYLTGLATRWFLRDFIERNRHERNITCVYLDLDNFKQVNDTLGHQAGDRALAVTAEMMQREFPDGFCARMGGDEFMAVFLGRRDIGGMEARVNEFMAKLLKYCAGSRTMKALSVSAGISQTQPDSDKTIDQIIHEADRALYEAKKSGKARCKIYSPSMG